MDGTWNVREEGHSFGPDEAKPAFQRWLNQFKNLDQQMARGY